MQTTLDENVKRRLTEHAEMRVAVDFLKVRGFDDEEIVSQLTRFYYVDIDMLNAILMSDRKTLNRLCAADELRTGAAAWLHDDEADAGWQPQDEPYEEPLRAVA